MQDAVFADPKMQVSDFEFNASVVNVFDDMVVRSVPFYLEIQRMVAELASDLYKKIPGFMIWVALRVQL